MEQDEAVVGLGKVQDEVEGPMGLRENEVEGQTDQKDQTDLDVAEAPKVLKGPKDPTET
jgi:hypothetical protein